MMITGHETVETVGLPLGTGIVRDEYYCYPVIIDKASPRGYVHCTHRKTGMIVNYSRHINAVRYLGRRFPDVELTNA